MELRARIQELQNEGSCMGDSRKFKDAEWVRSGPSHVTSQPALCQPYRDPGGLLSRSLGMPSRKNGPPSIWDTHGVSGNVFCKSTGVFFATYPGEFNLWISQVTEDTLVLTSAGGPVTCGERQIPDTVLNPRCQSGPSARNSFDQRGKISKDMEQTNNGCRFRIFISTNSPRQQRLFVGR